MGLIWIHLRAAHSINHDGCRVGRPMASPCRRNKPVIVIRRHQHELSPAVSSDLDGLAASLMLDLTELPLHLKRCGPDHRFLECS